MLQTLHIAYFSPTGGTKRAALCLGRMLARETRATDLSMQSSAPVFTADDAVLFAAPVFGGRIPSYALQRLQQCEGNGAAAITAVVYGNRAYDDALLELTDSLKRLGFRIAASAALIAEHSMLRTLATGRPDAQDQSDYREFAEKIAAKLCNEALDEPVVPGKRPYAPWTAPPMTPAASADCTRCGLCAASCPTGAIPQENPQTTDRARCMLCMRCVAICPQQARALPPTAQAMLQQKLSPLKNIRRANELFL